MLAINGLKMLKATFKFQYDQIIKFNRNIFLYNKNFIFYLYKLKVIFFANKNQIMLIYDAKYKKLLLVTFCSAFFFFSSKYLEYVLFIIVVWPSVDFS